MLWALTYEHDVCRGAYQLEGLPEEGLEREWR